MLLRSLMVRLFLAVSTSALADETDMTKPLSQMTGDESIAARKAAIQQWSNMTPEEREAAVTSALDKKTTDWTALDWWAADNPQTLNERRKAKPKPQPPRELGLPNWPINPYGSTPMTTSGGTPLVDDFNEKGRFTDQPDSKGKRALPKQDDQSKKAPN